MRKRNMLVVLVVFVLSGAMLFAGGQGERQADQAASLDIWAVRASEIPLGDEVPVWVEVEDRVGTELNWRHISTEVKDEQFNIMLASQELPDIVAYYEGQGGHSSINRFGGEGAFLPLEDLINEHAPNLKRMVLDDPVVRSEVTAPDGNIYFIPMMSALNAARGWYIRVDWLEKLGLDMPETVDDLYEVMVAFRDGDPNETGQNDTIPSVFRHRGDDAFYNLGALAYAFDADTSWVLRGDKVVFGPTEPQYLDYVAYLQKLYAERLIDREHFTRGGNTRSQLIGGNIAGVIHDWFASTAGMNSLESEIPGFKLLHMPPPVADGVEPFTRIQMSQVRSDGGWAITSSVADAVAAIKMMDFVFSDEGRRLTNFGIEGVHHTMQDGMPVYTEFITNNPDGLGMHEALVSIGAQWKVGMVQDVDYEAQFANVIATEARLDYMENYIIDEFPTLNFTPREQDILEDKFSQIRTFVMEMKSRAVVGGLTMAQFENQLNELNRMGIAEVTEIYQQAYDRR